MKPIKSVKEEHKRGLHLVLNKSNNTNRWFLLFLYLTTSYILNIFTFYDLLSRLLNLFQILYIINNVLKILSGLLIWYLYFQMYLFLLLAC